MIMKERSPATAEAIIRSARPTDFPSLLDLWRQEDRCHAEICPDFFREPKGDPRTEKEYLESLRRPGHAAFLVEIDDTVVGYLGIQIYETPAKPNMVQRRRALLEDLVIDGAYRKMGFGGALLKRAIEWARQEDVSHLVLTVWEGNEGAEKLYREQGFTSINRLLGLRL
jgi:ribosomal protein S18 acetylase RimI-like enzyme